MGFRTHHIFVCTSVDAPEAALLDDVGLMEGSRNTHPGQGTANRRYFFRNGYLELLWVHDEEEARSDTAGSTGLWERWLGRNENTCPFGIGFSSSEGVGAGLPFETWAYRPSYLPDGHSILFADGMTLSEPEIFVLGWPQGTSSPVNEPTDHPLGLVNLHAAWVGIPDLSSISDTLRAAWQAGFIGLFESDEPRLVVEFTSDEEVTQHIPSLGLTMAGRPEKTIRARPLSERVERMDHG